MGAITHSTPADPSFSAAGAAAWDAEHNVAIQAADIQDAGPTGIALIQAPSPDVAKALLGVADGLDGLDGIDGPPGPVGPAGPQGVAGARGLVGADGLDGQDGLPGAIGPQGIQGPAGGGGGGSFTAFTKDLGVSRRSGTFDITGLSGLTAAKQVSIVQTMDQVASRGNARDEFELDPITLTGYVVDTTTIRALWACAGGLNVAVGTYAFAYQVSG